MTTIRFETYGGAFSQVWNCEARGADERGAWFWCAPASAVFIPWNADWCVRFTDAEDMPAFHAYSVKPVRISSSVVEMIELWLGLEVGRDGETMLFGEEDLAQALEYDGMPQDFADRAQLAINDFLERWMTGEYPFDRSSEEVVASVRR